MEKIEIEVVGRHALLFDDDAMAAFVNSADALVEWNSIPIDRYDVRHLLLSPPPTRSRRQHHADSDSNSIEAQLDYERYLYLSYQQQQQEPEPEPDHDDSNQLHAAGYNAVPFSYDDSLYSQEEFRPPFSVPDNLPLPPTEKLHQIIARTAIFVSKHGGQSEIILRVKQGDNPTFGFLMPDHQLHSYFRFLVDHREVLSFDDERKSPEEKTSDTAPFGGGGALSLLGSLYGSVDDEEGAAESALTSKQNLSREAVNAAEPVAHVSEKFPSPKRTSINDEGVLNRLTMSKDKAPVVRRSSFINGSKVGSGSTTRKESDFRSLSSATEKLRASSVLAISKIEPLFVEPPSEIKKLVNKIVEFIIKNGKQFETVLIEQDSEHGRFPFLFPSNQYNPYYLKVLQEAQKSKVTGKGSSNEKDVSLSLESAACDIPYKFDRKEKFKMVIGKSKNDGSEPTPKSSQQQFGVGVDATAAAAILQAATRGIRNPDLGFLSRPSMNGTTGERSSEVGHVSSLGSFPASLPYSVNLKDQSGECTFKRTVTTGAPEAAGEAESCETHLTREQKLKAERLRRARMFVSMIKSGPTPPKTEPSRGLSVEPQGFNAFGAAASEDNLAAKEIDGSAAPMEIETSKKIEYSGKKLSADEYNERMSRRKYRSKTSVNEEAEDFVDDAEVLHRHSRKKHCSRRSSSEDDGVEQERVNKHSRKKHRLPHSSHCDELEDDERDHNYSRKQHRSHRSAHEEDEEDENEHDHRHYRKKHRPHRSSHDSRDGHKHRKRRSSSRDKERRHRHKREISSGEEEQLDSVRSDKLRKGSQSDREELEEGEISSKVSDQSGWSVGFGGSNREASVDKSVRGVAKRRDTSMDVSSSHQEQPEPTEVSDDLRAKIRAMLMGTL